MRSLIVGPQVHTFDDFAGFANEFNVGKGDLVFTHEFIYEPSMKALNLECDFLFQENYGGGEPTSTMVDKIRTEIEPKGYKRIIAVGGGSVIDIAKILSLKDVTTTCELYERKIDIVKGKELVIVPTTCGTGSEVTNVSVCAIEEKNTKLGLGVDEMYANHAVLIAELVKSLPYKFFVSCSLDALVHATEAYTSPKASCNTELFSVAAITTILNGYKKMIAEGPEARFDMMAEFLTASCQAGIAFGNAGCAGVHALSMTAGSKYHIAHGESNYVFFTEVYKTYYKMNPTGEKLQKLNKLIAGILGCEADDSVYAAMDEMFNKLLPLKKLSEYGATEEDLPELAAVCHANQQRLLTNNFVPFTEADILAIYKNLF